MKPNEESTLISRQAALDAIAKIVPYGIYDKAIELYADGVLDAFTIIRNLPPIQAEKLTDKEQRIFLAAMGREEKVCKEVDDECRNCCEPYEDSLVKVCYEITRKVKSVLWT